MEKATKFQNELIEFSVDVINLAENFTKKVPKPVTDQLIRSATSVGANYAEAINSSSRADFKNKIYIAKKEASETKYWFDVLFKLTKSDELILLRERLQKYIMTLQKTINTLNEKGKSIK